MDRAISLGLLATVILLVVCPKAESQWVSHHPAPPATLPPLCSSQFALANRACSVLPYTVIPPPSPPSIQLPPPAESHHHHSHHHHGHSHRHSRHRHKETAIEKDCCRWLREVDHVCVCGLLLHLAPFLARPAHNYTVFVDDSCAVTFTCPSRFVPLWLLPELSQITKYVVSLFHLAERGVCFMYLLFRFWICNILLRQML